MSAASKCLLFAVVGWAFLTPSNAYCASFDCKKAATKVERAICDDADLSRLDEEMGDLYRQVREALKADQLDEVKADQRRWVTDRNRRCAEAADIVGCLSASIRRRMTQLEAQLPAPDPRQETKQEYARRDNVDIPAPHVPKNEVKAAMQRIEKSDGSSVDDAFHIIIARGDLQQVARAFQAAPTFDLRLRLIERAIELGSKEAMIILAKSILNGEVTKYGAAYARALLAEAGTQEARNILAKIEREDAEKRKAAEDRQLAASRKAEFDSRVARLTSVTGQSEYDTEAKLLEEWGACSGFAFAVLRIGVDRLQREISEAGSQLMSVWQEYYGPPAKYADVSRWETAYKAAVDEGDSLASGGNWEELRNRLTGCLVLANSVAPESVVREKGRTLTLRAMNVGLPGYFDPEWACRNAIAKMLNLAKKGARMCYEFAEHSRYSCPHSASQSDLLQKIEICNSAIRYQ